MTDLDLEAQIVAAELAVITRDERIRLRAGALVHRARQGTTLRNAGIGGLVGAASVGLTWWLARRHRRAAAAAPAPDRSEGEHLAREAGLSLAGLLPLIWPMLPHSLRRSVTPGMASSVLAFVTPWLARLFRRTPRAPRAAA